MTELSSLIFYIEIRVLLYFKLKQIEQNKFWVMFPKQNGGEQSSDFKKKREVFAQNMRKNDRDQIFSKRRNILLGENSSNINSQGNQPQVNKKENKLLIVDERFKEQIQAFLKTNYTMDMFPQLLQAITHGDIVKQHYGLIGVRKILSIADNPPIQSVIDAGLVPRMIEYVKQPQYPQLQLEATWALTNVASGTSIQCQSIIDKGGIPLFVELLTSKNLGIVEQAIWAIGNISSDCVFYRDNIIRAGGLNNLVMVAEKVEDQALIKHCCWAMSNLCRGNPLPKYQSVKPAIPLLCKLVAHGRLNDREIIADTCWAISYHSDATKGKINVVIDSGAVPKIIQNLYENSISLLIPSIRIIGNISTGTMEQTNQLLNHDLLTPLEKLLEHSKKVVRREAAWVLSNISAGNRSQVEAIISRPNLLKKVLQLFETDGGDVRRQICYIFSNMSHAGQPSQIFNLYKECQLIRYYVNLLSSDEAKTIEVSLQCLFIVLAHGEKFKGTDKNPLVMDLHNQGAVDVLEQLQYHKSDIVYQNVSKILQAYFEIQDPLDL